MPGTITALLDSGSNANVMSSQYFEKNIAPLHVLHSTGQKAVAFNGAASSILGEYKSEVIFNNTALPVDFQVVKDIKYDAMLGRQFLDQHVETINTRDGTVKLNDGTFIDIVRKNIEPACRPSHTINYGSLRINTLHVRPRRRWFRSRYRVYPADWRDPKTCAY